MSKEEFPKMLIVTKGIEGGDSYLVPHKSAEEAAELGQTVVAGVYALKEVTRLTTEVVLIDSNGHRTAAAQHAPRPSESSG